GRGGRGARGRSGGASRGQSFDHLVGDGEQRRRHGEADRAGGLVIDDELELGRLYDRQIGWLRTLEDAAHIDAGLAKPVRYVRSVSHQPAHFGIGRPSRSDGRDGVARRKVRQLNAPVAEEGTAADEKSIRSL